MRPLSERLQKQRAEREASQHKVDEDLRAHRLGAHIRDVAYSYAWDERHSSGLHEVESMYSDLLRMLIKAHIDGMSSALEPND